MSNSINEKDLGNITGGTDTNQDPKPVSDCSNNFWNPCAKCSCLQSRTNLQSIDSKCPSVFVSCSANRFNETIVPLDTFIMIAQRSKGPFGK